MEIIKKYDENLKKYVFHCKDEKTQKTFKFIDSESEQSFSKAQEVAEVLLKYV